MVGSSFLEDISKEFTDSPDPFDFEATLLGEDVRMLFPDTLDVQMYGLDNVAALQAHACEGHPAALWPSTPPAADGSGAAPSAQQQPAANTNSDDSSYSRQVEAAVTASDAAEVVGDKWKRMKASTRKAQRRYRERQKERLVVAEARVEELSRELEQLRTQQKEAARPAPAAPANWWMDDKMQRYMMDSLQLQGDVVMTISRDRPICISHQQIMELKPQVVGQYWRKYLEGFAECMIQWKGDPLSPAARRLERWYWEAAQLWGSISIRFPDDLQVLRSYLGCGSRSQNDPTINANDRRLAAAAQLSQEQRQALCALRVPFYTNLGRLEAQRARLTAQLQEAMPVPKGGAPRRGAGGSAADGRFALTMAVMQQLKDVLRDEHCCYEQASMMIYMQVLSVFQGAHLCIQAYPECVRIFAVTETVASESEQPSLAELQQRGAQDPNAALLPLEEALPPSMGRPSIPPPVAGLAGDADNVT